MSDVRVLPRASEGRLKNARTVSLELSTFTGGNRGASLLLITRIELHPDNSHWQLANDRVAAFLSATRKLPPKYTLPEATRNFLLSGGAWGDKIDLSTLPWTPHENG